MTQTSNQFLSAFDALPLGDQHQVATELLRRTLSKTNEEVAEEALVSIADELFQQLDVAEADDAKS